MKNVPVWIRNRRVGVLYGGRSNESAISRRTGKAVLKALRSLGLKAVGIEAGVDVAEKIRRGKIGFCFIALHGKFGEDGTVQGLCEMMGIPYSGSGVLASALSLNKDFSKRIFASEGLRTPDFEVVSRSGASISLKLPVVVKPVDGGSAIGVNVVRKSADLAKGLSSALKESDRVLVERFIGGKEVTAAILGNRVLPLIEIVPKSSFYDYRAKYVKGMSDHVIPARIPRKAKARVREMALRAHRAMGCVAFSRVDFIVDASGRPWLLELNSVPGMTETSLFPDAARAAGYSFPQMVLEIIRQSRARP